MTESSEEDLKYQPGVWIVHCHHGVGQIKAAERMRMSGKETSYFRIDMKNSTIWIPIDQMDTGQLRPISESTEFLAALELLKGEPNELDPNINIRNNQIKEIINENTPSGTAQLVRDLWAREHKKGNLNESERRAYRTLSDRLLQEWSLCMDVEIDEARASLDRKLRYGDEVETDQVMSDEQELPA